MSIAEQTLPPQTRKPLPSTARPVATETARRIQRLVAGFRLLVALGLLLITILQREPPLLDPRFPQLFASTALFYSLVATLILTLQWRAGPANTARTLIYLCVDVVAVTVLSYAGGGISTGIGGLLVVLAGAASMSLRADQALFAAALVVLAVLGEQTLAYAQGLAPVNAFVPTGMLGAIIFLTMATANPLARRLQESEALALQRGIDLANLAQLNEYVIQNLRESIVVVDERDCVRLMNQSAAALLGCEPDVTGRPLAQLAPELRQILRNWRRGYFGPDSTMGFPSAGGATRVNTYFAPLEGRQDGPVLMFLEDSTLLAEKVRQTKLAALGRLSASIAHEIRNPVGALSHAGQLLGESPAIGEQEQRLLNIIDVNSRRVSEIVENVMQLSRRETTRPESIELGRWLRDFITEFLSTLELPPDSVEVAAIEPELEVRMDPSHLRQVCWNLCDNALHFGHGADETAHIEMSFGRMPANGRPYLAIADRGPGIDPDIKDRLFEPFATGRAGGSGLGLFISRELCECNRAALSHEERDGGGSLFRIVFADPRRWGNTR